MKKRFLGIATMFSILIGLFVVPVSASAAPGTNDPTVIVSNAAGRAGDTVDVTISLENNPGIVSMLLGVGYNRDALTLKSVADAEVLGTHYHNPDLERNPYILFWADGTATENFTANGTVATLTFEIKNGTAAGEYPITVTYDEDNVYNVDYDNVTFAVVNGKVTVEESTPATISVTGVTLDKTSLTLEEGGNATLTATVVPDNATNKAVTWATSNAEVATVSEGVVTAVAEGTATITVTTEDGSFAAECAVTVNKPTPATISVTGVALNNPLIALEEGETKTLTATVAPETATNKDVTWSTSNANVATVENGVVTAVAAGVATITVTTVDGEFTASCVITVNENASVLIGDLNNDGKVNSKDLTVLARHIAKWIGYDENSVNVKAADTNYDGKVNSFDLTVIARHMAKWIGYEVLPAKFADGVPGTVSADGNPTITVSSVNAMAGETVDVTVRISDNPGITSMLLNIGYDSSALTLKSVVDAGVLGTQFHSNDYAANPYTLFWANGTAWENYTANGIIATLTFEVKDGIAAGDYPITVTYDNDNAAIYNASFETADFAVVNGKVTVEESAPTIVVSNVAGEAGDTVDVTVSLENNPGIATMLLSVGYNSDALTLKSVTDAGVLGTQYHIHNYAANPYTLFWSNGTATENFTANGTVATLKFEIKDGTAAGEYPIIVTYEEDDVYDVDEENVAFAVVNGKVKVNVVSPCTVTYTGDYTGTQIVGYNKKADLPNEYGYTYTFEVDNEIWDGVVKGDTTVVVTKTPINYTITYAGGYVGTDNADYLTSVIFPTAPYGYTYTFKVNNKLWDGVVRGDTTVTVVKAPINYTLTYTGDYTGTQLVAYNKKADLPNEYGYTYTFEVDNEIWDGVVKGDTTVVVTKTPINYTVTYTGGYEGTDNADYLTSVIFPTAPYGYTYTFKVNGSIWDGIVWEDTSVSVIKTPINYTITYTGDYAGTDSADYLSSVTFPSAPYGYTYTFKVNDELWDGIVKGDTTVAVTKTINNYTVTYTGDYEGTDSADYLSSVTFPTAPYGYTYTFKVNDELWDGIVKGDTTVTVVKNPINYTVTYTGDYEGTDNADYLTSVTFPTAPYGYTYTFKVNDELWDGVVKGDTTVVVTKTPINYTVTYTGDYTETLTADYLTSVTLPTPPENYIYRFTANDEEWDGVVKGDTTVNVKKLYDLTELDITNIEDVRKDKDSIYGKFYGKSFTPQVTVSENALYAIYADSECTQVIGNSLMLTRGENTFYIAVTAESGRKSVYKVTVDRDIPENLGTLSVVQAVKDTMTFRLDKKLVGNPTVKIIFAKTQDAFDEYSLCEERTATISGDKQSLYITGLTADEMYYFKAIAIYDEIETESSVVLAYTAQSGDCYVIQVLSPAGGKIDHEKGTISDLSVMNRFDEIEINVSVSPKATWELYFDKKATQICADKTLALTAGEEKTAYIKVTAADGTEKVYSISIYRQTKSEKPSISVSGDMATITSVDGKNILYTIDGTYPTEFNGITYSEPFEISEGMTIRAIAKQDGKDEYSDVVSYEVDEIITTIYGDVTGDGKVNTKDITALARFVAHWIGYDETTVNLPAADVNSDGKVNTKDITALARFVAHWIGYNVLPISK